MSCQLSRKHDLTRRFGHPYVPLSATVNENNGFINRCFHVFYVLMMYSWLHKFVRTSPGPSLGFFPRTEPTNQIPKRGTLYCIQLVQKNRLLAWCSIETKEISEGQNCIKEMQPYFNIHLATCRCIAKIVELRPNQVHPTLKANNDCVCYHLQHQEMRSFSHLRLTNLRRQRRESQDTQICKQLTFTIQKLQNRKLEHGSP